MKIKRLTLALLFSIAALCSCTDDALENNPDLSAGSDDLVEESAIDVTAIVDEDYINTKGTSITQGIEVKSIGIFVNTRTAIDGNGGVTTESVDYLSNSEIKRNIYGKLEFLETAYWPVLAEGENLGFVAYSPYTDVKDGEGETTDSGLSNATSSTMEDLKLHYVVPENVANQPDLLVSDPVEQSEGAVPLTFTHALATVVFNVKGDGMQTVKEITISNIAYEGDLALSYTNRTESSVDGESVITYTQNIDWTLATEEIDGVTSVKRKEFTLSVENNTLTEVTPSYALTPVSSVTGHLMMIPQTVGAATDIKVTFNDGKSRSLRFFDNQDWQAAGLYSYNINVEFEDEGEIVDFSDASTVNKLVNNSDESGELETANCYILNPPVYSKEQESGDAAVAASEPLVFTRAEDGTTAVTTSTTNYGALYYIPISSRLEDYYVEYCGDKVPTHDDWAPVIVWYDCKEDPRDDIIIKRGALSTDGEERFSVYVPYGYDNFGNISVAVKSDEGDIIWSWHLWITDYNPYYDNTLGYDAKATGETGAYYVDVEGGELHHYADNQKASPVPYYWSSDNYYLNRLIMDRNSVALDNNGGAYDDTDRTMGLYYQFGRKDPFPHTPTYTPTDRTYKVDLTDARWPIQSAIEHPLTFFITTAWGGSTGVNNYYNWCSVEEYTYVWGDATYNTTDKENAGEYYKSIFDPSPIGFMVPTMNVWNDFITATASSGISVVCNATDGLCYKLIDGGLEAHYPMANALHAADNGTLGDSSWSACWSSTPTTIYNCYSWANMLYFQTNGTITPYINTNTAVTSRIAGLQVRPIQRWYNKTIPGATASEE